MHICGSLHGLKPFHYKQLERISSQRVRTDSVVSYSLASSLALFSHEVRRQIGVLINRNGSVVSVIVGDSQQIFIPSLERMKKGRLRGLRLVHTHLKKESLTQEDLYDLILLRLDYITAITIDGNGLPEKFYSAYILPGTDPGCFIEEPCLSKNLPENFSQILDYLEVLFQQEENRLKRIQNKSRALPRCILVGIYTPSMRRERTPDESMRELCELCKTANLLPVSQIIQKRSSLDPTSLVGSGKAKEIALKAVQLNAELIIFDLELSAVQAKRLSQICDLKIIDRTQLILDIFSCHAHSKDGKLQVELAQLRYLKERLSEKDDNMSRLTGGIGGRGPGETKLEIGRRKVRERIRRLEKELSSLKKHRQLLRSNRAAKIHLVSILGYTNTGKSTLLNSLSGAHQTVQDQMFATLEPVTRRLSLGHQKKALLTDTVGFIHDLPPELQRSFEATLEELSDSDLILHCIDSSDPTWNRKIKAVEQILGELKLLDLPCIYVMNKCDLLSSESMSSMQAPENSVFVSAQRKINLDILLAKIQQFLFTPKKVWEQRQIKIIS